MTKWEYLLVKRKEIIDNEDLNDLGAKGWELVNVIYIPPPPEGLGPRIANVGDHTEYLFKRPVEAK